MPYKNPQDKRRWEREHREERNARRRVQRLGPAITKQQPDPAPQRKSGWIPVVLGIGIAALSALAEARSKLR